MKERFQKVVCGWNYSLALTEDSRVYYWGNYRYHGGATNKEDVLVPTPLKSLEGRLIKDIACNRHQCYALNDKGEIFQWGRYLKEKIEGVKKSDGGPRPIYKFPNTSSGKSDVIFESLCTGPNHSAGISFMKTLYTWGFP